MSAQESSTQHQQSYETSTCESEHKQAPHMNSLYFADYAHETLDNSDGLSDDDDDDDDPYTYYDSVLSTIKDDKEAEVEHDDKEGDQHAEEAYDYQEDTLLQLVVGVQSYLSDLSCSGLPDGSQDSPLNDLQYKMYTYLKRRAHDMGVLHAVDEGSS